MLSTESTASNKEQLRSRRGTAQGPALLGSGLLRIPVSKNRKSSLPIINPLQRYDESGDKSDYDEFTSEALLTAARIGGKRLSAVGIAFTQQLQSMALRLSTNHQDVIEKMKILCARYLRRRLSESGLLTKRSCLQRLRSMGNIEFDPLYDDLMDKISILIKRLESQRPGLYESVVDQIGRSKLILSSPERASQALTILLEQLFRKSITWPKIAAMFAVTGALGVDAAKRGKQDYTITLIDTVAEFSKNGVSEWIFDQGGWKSLLYRFNKESFWFKVMKYFSVTAPIVAMFFAIAWVYF